MFARNLFDFDDFTVTDLFCGAGGNSEGAKQAGAKIIMAANHWRLAIETHSANHPETEHDCADIRQAHPAWYNRTAMLIASPECTNHSVAKGKKRKNTTNEIKDPAAERSRATMWEVVQFAEYHRYPFVVIENVVDVAYWTDFSKWLTAMKKIGYSYRILYLNSQFFGAPQSRDRMYVVFWMKGIPTPDLDFRPWANCPEHGNVQAIQTWKKDKHWGRYGDKRQYVYTCPTCQRAIRPFYLPAAYAIDWSIPSVKIGERKKPLKEKTVQRILAGLEKYARPQIMNTAYEKRTTTPDEPLPTQTARQSFALIDPFLLNYVNNASQPRAISEPLQTIPTRNTPPLVTPPSFIASYYSREDAQSSINDAMPTITTEKRHALVGMPFIAVLKNAWSPDGTYTLPPRDLSETLTTIVASASQHALISPPVMLASVNYFDEIIRPVDQPMPTQTTANKLALVTPFIAEMHGTSVVRGVDEPLMAIVASAQHHGLTTPPFVTSLNHSDERSTPVTRPLPTVMTQAFPSLVVPGEFDPAKLLLETGFRMLEPHELKRGMAFPDEYLVFGNKRDQVKQAGNAVTPPVMRWIVGQCIAAVR